jgi:putative membrane protein
MAVTPIPQEQRSHPLAAAIRELTRFERFNVAVMLFLVLITVLVFSISWVGHNAGLQMHWSIFGTFLVWAVVVWHSVHVMGWRQTVAFQGLTMALSFVAEYMGANYGWIFGSYDYTSTAGPSINGVSVLVPFTWGIIVYAVYMLIDLLLDLHGERRGSKWYGKVIWSAMIALTTGIVVAAWDLMADPVYVSGVWEDLLGKPPWWWWDGGAYLPNLRVWKGAGGIPVQNFFGWMEVTFVIVFIFNLFFQRRNRTTHRLIYAVPLLVFSWLFLISFFDGLVMTWYDPGLVQAVMIGFFGTGATIMLGVLKFCKEYWRPAEA